MKIGTSALLASLVGAAGGGAVGFGLVYQSLTVDLKQMERRLDGLEEHLSAQDLRAVPTAVKSTGVAQNDPASLRAELAKVVQTEVDARLATPRAAPLAAQPSVEATPESRAVADKGRELIDRATEEANSAGKRKLSYTTCWPR